MKKIIKCIIAIILCLQTLCLCSVLGGCNKSHGEGNKIDFVASYDYGMFNSGKLTTLLNGCEMFFDPQKYSLGTIYAGETLTVEYTGDMYCLESYPGRVVINNGKIICITKNRAKVVGGFVYTEQGVTLNGKLLSGYLPEYVISKDFSFTKISDLQVGSTLFGAVLSQDENKLYNGENVIAFYDFNIYEN